VRSRQAGNFCHRDIKVAKGELALPDGEKALAPQLALIEAAFRECELADLQATAAAIGDAAATLKNLREYLSEKIGADRAPDFRVLTKELESMGRLLSEQLAHRGVATLPAGQQAAGMSAPSAVSEALGEVRTREDVVRILDKVSDYFEKYEPSSPVPLLLQRAKRLVAKDFMEILRDLTPAGVAQAEAIGGLDKHK
jgi:type VI secretion system protein ImpA